MRLVSRNYARGKPKANRDVLGRLGSPTFRFARHHSFCRVVVKDRRIFFKLVVTRAGRENASLHVATVSPF
jgi:hypothetical protein